MFDRKEKKSKESVQGLLDNAGVVLGFDKDAFSDGAFSEEENSDSDDEVIHDAQFMDANDMTLGFE